MFLNLAVIDDEGLGGVDDRSEDGDWDLNNNDLHNVDLVADGKQGGLDEQYRGVGREQALTKEVGNVVVFAVQGLDGLLVFRIDVVAVRFDDTGGHRHQDWTYKAGDAGDRDLEDDAQLVDDAPDGDQHTGGQALDLADQVGGSFLQAVALQGAGQDHQDDGDQLAAAGDKVGADDLQQVNHVDAASDCGDDGGDKDDGDRFEFNGEAYNYDKHAK